MRRVSEPKRSQWLKIHMCKSYIVINVGILQRLLIRIDDWLGEPVVENPREERPIGVRWMHGTWRWSVP